MARRIRGQLLDGMLETMAQPTIGLDRSGAVRFYSESFKKLYPELKEGKTLWQHDVGAPINAGPAVTSKLIVVGAEDGSVFAFAPSQGADKD